MASGWQGARRAIVEAMPHERRQPTIDDLKETLSHLKIDVFESKTSLQHIQTSDCPGLFVAETGEVLGLLDRNDNQFLIKYPARDNAEWVDANSVRGKLMKIILPRPELIPPQPIGMARVWAQKNFVAGLLIASLLTNLFAFATPLFVMALYDRIMPVGSVSLLLAILIGLAIILIGDLSIRLIRARTIAHLGAKVELAMGLSLFDKLMSLPLVLLQKSDINQQLTRFRQFESLRDAFTGSVLSSFLDLPFTLIFLIVIFQISVEVGTCVAILALVFAIAYLVTAPIQKTTNRAAAASKVEQQKLIMELASHQRHLRRLGAEDLWRSRLNEKTIDAARCSRRSRQLGLYIQTFGQTLMMIAGATTIVYGTFSAMEGTMSMGALIASMALVWRVLAPIHALFIAAPQISGYVQSAAQSNRVLQIEGELKRTTAQSSLKSFTGALGGRGVLFRYNQTADPALAGINFNFEAGQRVAIAGSNGSGKSTLLNVIDGLYTPQSGALTLDGVDFRQIAVEDLRASISYAPQTVQFFHGTIAQNLLLNNPMASEDEIWKSLLDVGLEQDIRHMPDGIHTRLTEELRSRMSPSVLRAIMLARTFIKEAPIYLFDEPFNGLDSLKHDAFFRRLDTLKGHATVLLVTRRPSHFALMDRVVFFDQGRILVDDVSAVAAKKILAIEAMHKKAE